MYQDRLNIGIDGQALLGKRTGVGRYVFELCKELDKLFPNATFFVYSREPIEMPVQSERWVLRMDTFPLKRLCKPWIKFRGTFLCKKDNLDVFWGGTSFLPFLPKKVRKIVTVHDLNYKIVPETMSNIALLQFKLFFEKDILKANYVLCVSKGSSNRLKQFVGREADAIVPPAISETFTKPNKEEILTVFDKFNIKKPYLLAVATFEPRKNLELLISTFLGMKEKGEVPNHQLLLVGGKGWKDERLVALLKNDKTKSIQALGYVDDEDLPALYTGADVFVFPSIYEGFGMPVLEARAVGTKAIATDIPELREAGEEDAIYIDASAQGIRCGILEAIENTSEVNMLDREQYTWEKSAKTIALAMKGNL
ncbi:glycosyltransferase family 4 protein [Niallia hominis]|uniref:Glycosyltransferase family 1 protein n=1 Tax=Niallia hominis TaxID=3133173 RepID=A0ABV1F4I8_9BACI